MGRTQGSFPYYVGMLTLVGIVFLVGIVALDYISPNFNLSVTQTQTQTGTGTSTTGPVSVTKPLEIALRDSQAGLPVSGGTVVVFDSSLHTLEILTTDSTGIGQSAQLYPSGTPLTLQKSATGYVTEFSQRVVPQMSRVDAESLAANRISETLTKKPSLVISVTDRNGNVISDGGSFNMSGLSSAQFTVSVINTLDNSGWKTSYDPINKVSLGLASVISPSDKVVISGTGTLVNRGTVSHLVTAIPDAQITRTAVGSQVTGGTYSFTFTVNRGTLAANSSATVTISVNGYFDQAYYASYGIGGILTETLADFDFTVLG